jgi:pSer/pThr/pTyr-binding forkhead associated (FHA) protein
MTISVNNPFTVLQFSRKVAGMPKSMFLRKHSTPYLLVELREGTLDSGRYTTIAPDRDNHFNNPKALAGSILTPDEIAIVPVQKSDKNTFHNIVTLGRSSNNDIVIHFPSVSKLHAIFKEDPSTGNFTLTDADSTFGTMLENVPLIPREPAALQSGISIVFARSVRATFFDADDLFEYIELQKKLKRLPGS